MSSTIALNNDEDLLLKLAAGDESALELMFRKYYAPLVRFGRDILKNKEQAEDVVQDVFAKIWDKREHISITSSLKAYLYVAVKNHCFNLLKQNERKYWMEDGMEDDMRLSVNNTVDLIAAKTLDQKIRSSIDLLPPKCSLIFKMSRYDQKSYKEIAEALDLSVKTVENQIGKALQLMREYLKPHMKDVYIAIGFILFANWN